MYSSCTEPCTVTPLTHVHSCSTLKQDWLLAFLFSSLGWAGLKPPSHHSLTLVSIKLPMRMMKITLQQVSLVSIHLRHQPITFVNRFPVTYCSIPVSVFENLTVHPSLCAHLSYLAMFANELLRQEQARLNEARKISVVNVNPTNIRPHSDTPEIRKYKKRFNSEILCAALWGETPLPQGHVHSCTQHGSTVYLHLAQQIKQTKVQFMFNHSALV